MIKKGDKIKVDYEGRFYSGELFDTSQHGGHSHPLEFEVGSGQVIKGFDSGVLGMKKGEEKEIEIEPEEAYGGYREDLNKEIPRKALPPEQEPKEGMMLALRSADGQQITAVKKKVAEEKVTIDMNHPLAGKKLMFKIKIVDVEKDYS